MMMSHMSVEPEPQLTAPGRDSIRIMGIRFVNGSAHEVVREGLEPGLVVIPSAPVLVRMMEDPAHHQALIDARMAVLDSGLMVLLWRIYTGQKLQRVSGLRYLQFLLARREFLDSPGVLWVMPSAQSRDTNLSWLRSRGHVVNKHQCYVAPQYPPGGFLADEALCRLIRENRPRHVILALGGGTQERLGWFLVRRFPGQLTVHCVGAAIGFLSGDQVGIPSWADRAFLGWLFRCCSDPRRYIPRYWKAIGLAPALWRYRNQAPMGASN